MQTGHGGSSRGGIFVAISGSEAQSGGGLGLGDAHARVQMAVAHQFIWFVTKLRRGNGYDEL